MSTCNSRPSYGGYRSWVDDQIKYWAAASSALSIIRYVGRPHFRDTVHGLPKSRFRVPYLHFDVQLRRCHAACFAWSEILNADKQYVEFVPLSIRLLSTGMEETT